jgi:8-amino-7-oxononanoate synthase
MFETKMNQFIDEEILALEAKGLRRSLKTLSGKQSSRIILNGREVLNFCSNNYLALAEDARLVEAAIACMKREGFGSGASRLVCGNMNAHELLERELAEFKGEECALVFSTGYMANVGIISALMNREDIIFSDKLNHASIIDGINLSQAEFKRYPHCDMDALEAMLKSCDVRFRRRWIITDTVFSMDGDIAPLDKIVELAKRYDGHVMIDDAHGFGVLGKNGKGALEHFALTEGVDVQMGTLSKAAGSFGAYCCGKRNLIDLLINKSRSFIYTTALPPAVAAASHRAIQIIRDEPDRRKKLWQNAEYIRGQLDSLGFNTMASTTPIIPVLVKDAKLVVEFSKRLLDRGIFVAAIRPATVPAHTARLRLTVTCAHTLEDLRKTVAAFQLIGKELGII